MVKYNGRKIIYTFRYGTCLTGFDKTVYVLWTAFFFVLGISLFIPCYLEKHKFTAYEILTVCCVAGSVFLGLSIYYLLKNKRAEKEILMWLADEQLFEACAEVCQLNKMRTKNIYSYKLGISFENDGEKYSRVISRTEKVRYFKRLKKIITSCKFNILYSPKYGEVMVFENEQGNK